MESCPSAKASTQWYWVAGARAGVSRSPRPRPTAVPPSSAKATSLPIVAAISASRCGVRPAVQSSLAATRAAAASALPPASPAATGIRLAMLTRTPAVRLPPRTCLRSAATARSARLSPSWGTVLAPSPVTVTVSRSAGSTVTSSNSATAWNTVTRS